MKKVLVCLLMLTVLLSGCGQSAAPAAAPETTAPAAETAPETTVPETAAPTETEAAPAVDFESTFSFSTTDRDGNDWDESCFAEHKLTILNFWEPWCGPCVREMPDLQKISEKYGDDLLILGIYETSDMEEEVQQVLDQAGTTYPILHYVEEFDFLQTGYVPTTVFVDQEGKILFEPFSSALSYDDWDQVVGELLQ